VQIAFPETTAVRLGAEEICILRGATLIVAGGVIISVYGKSERRAASAGSRMLPVFSRPDIDSEGRSYRQGFCLIGVLTLLFERS
jgi:hypothetical protein